jgi:hypothetical protein
VSRMSRWALAPVSNRTLARSGSWGAPQFQIITQDELGPVSVAEVPRRSCSFYCWRTPGEIGYDGTNRTSSENRYRRVEESELIHSQRDSGCVSKLGRGLTAAGIDVAQ